MTITLPSQKRSFRIPVSNVIPVFGISEVPLDLEMAAAASCRGTAQRPGEDTGTNRTPDDADPHRKPLPAGGWVNSASVQTAVNQRESCASVFDHREGRQEKFEVPIEQDETRMEINSAEISAYRSSCMKGTFLCGRGRGRRTGKAKRKERKF